jgi:hypothetical protein
MTIFELTFSLSSLILGLALTHMAASFYKLAHAGRRVRWASEPLLQAAIVLLVIVFVWLDQWEYRAVTTAVFWRVLLQVLKLMVLYVAAAACLPEVPEGESEISLYVHYDQTRRLSFGAMAAGLVLFDVYRLTGEQEFHWRWDMLNIFEFLVPYIAMMFVRQRWLNNLLLVAALIYWSSLIMTFRLTG